jgi:hypothetical protein
MEWNDTDGEERKYLKKKKTGPSDTLLNKNFTRTDRIETWHKTKINPNCVQRFGPYRAVNTPRLGYKNQSVNAV